MTLFMRSMLAAAWLSLSAGAMTPSTSSAGIFDVSAGALIYRDLGTVDNDLRISESAGTLYISDPADLGVVVTQGFVDAGCLVSVVVTCPTASITGIHIEAGNGTDEVDLTGVPIPAVVYGGPGFDRIVGGNGSDVIGWWPGDGADEFDGGPEIDTVLAFGGAGNETFVIGPDGPGFRVTRDFVTVWVKGTNVEHLYVDAGNGDDTVSSRLLPSTRQALKGGSQSMHDTFALDFEGACAWLENDEYSLPGRMPAEVTGFEAYGHYNYLCGAVMQLQPGGVLDYQTHAYVNDLHVTRSGQSYTFHDDAEAIITPSLTLRNAGCTTPEPNTVVCPTSIIASFDVYLGGGDDVGDFSGALAPVFLDGGAGKDTLTGGESDDTFQWYPYSSSDDDTIDGGPGFDTLDFRGTDTNETYTVTTEGSDGFRLDRSANDEDDVTLVTHGIELLDLEVRDGLDGISTVSLVATEQRITGGAFGSPTTLMVDADGRCFVREGDTLTTPGRPPIAFRDVEVVDVTNQTCRQDACALPSTSGCNVNGVANQPCHGTDAADRIVGTPGADVIHAGDGRDRVNGGGGDDVVCGEAGDDKLVGGAGADTLDGGTGADRLTGSSGNDVLLGGADADQLSGGSGADDLEGGAGDDRLKGGGDGDRLEGSEGTDLIDGGGTLFDVCTDYDQPGPFIRCETVS